MDRRGKAGLTAAVILLAAASLVLWLLTRQPLTHVSTQEAEELRQASNAVSFELKTPRYLPKGMIFEGVDVLPASAGGGASARLTFLGPPGTLDLVETQSFSALVYPSGWATVKQVKVRGREVRIYLLDATGHIYDSSMTAQIQVGDVYVLLNAKNLSEEDFTRILGSF